MSSHKLDHEELLESLGLYSFNKSKDFDSNKNRSTVVEPYVNESQYSYQHQDDNTELVPPVKKLFSMKIDLPDAHSDMIMVFENDDLTQVAKAFCKKHNLGEKFESIILDTLKSNCQTLVKDQTPKKANVLNSTTTTGIKNSDQKNKSQRTPEKDFFTLGDRKEGTPPTQPENNFSWNESSLHQKQGKMFTYMIISILLALQDNANQSPEVKKKQLSKDLEGY